jgi:TolB-like protein
MRAPTRPRHLPGLPRLASLPGLLLRRGRWLRLAGLRLAAGLAAGLLCAAALAQEGGVAVWDFEHQGLDGSDAAALAPVSRALAEILIEELLACPGTQVLERSRLREILDEQKIGASALADADTRLRLGRLAGARHMVFGSLLQLGDMARLDVRLVAVSTGQVLDAQTLSGALPELSAGMQGVARALANSLSSNPGQAPADSASDRPVQASAATLARFDSGLALMDRQDFAGALDIFLALLQTDPGFGPARRQIPVALEKLARQ